MIKEEKINIVAGHEDISTILLKKEDISLSCILLHGAGNSDKNRLIQLGKELTKIGLGSIVFDFSSHGESSHNEPTSLEKRTSEALKIIEHLDSKLPITICAFSMSGQVAINLLQSKIKNRIKNIILFAPALYDKRALNVPFGPEFSEIIRKKESWKNNNANENLKDFNGNILIFFSKNDHIIPNEIPDIIVNAAISASKKKILYLEQAPHQLARWSSEHLNNSKFIVESIVDFLNT
ncbi:alpha/beta hydrolase [uncultured Dokdonia sp.]|uniref:alpha/beta hydrolase n=1 Tax=uncultured Dokdonia sp. TaxID=575653 RepID=UPI00261303C9|nr:alpha/beta hydrolase [uncultured Dokdonia sp.]